MAAQWESEQRRSGVRRRLLLPLALVLAGVVAGVVWMPSDGRSDFSVVPQSEAALPGDPAPDATPADPIATASGGRWTVGDPGPLSPRSGAVVVATDREVIVWGGEALGSKLPLEDGAVYDLVQDRWRPIPDSPIPGRVAAAATWTGTEVVVWGGLFGTRPLDDGAAYNPRTGRWRRLPAAPLRARTDATAVYTRGRVLIWGGSGTGASHTDGAAYDPARNRWTRIPDGPLTHRLNRTMTALPTDDGMFVWSSNGTDARTALYDPRSRHWRTLSTPRLDPEHPVVFAALDGNVVAWGTSSFGGRGPLALVFTTSPDWWSTLAVPPLTPEPGQTMTGGRGMAVSWAGSGPGVMFDALVNRWEAMVGTPQPDAVGHPAQVWAGDRLFVWHGVAQPDAQRRTVVWQPNSPWHQVDGSPVSFANEMSVLWSGWLRDQQQVLIWGGYRDRVTNAGAAYDPALDLWETMPEAPIAGRYKHAAAFTGTEMVVLGGRDAQYLRLFDAAAYHPRRRVWRRLPDTPMHVTRGGAAWSGEALYAAGQRNGRTVVAQYDPGQRRWRVLPAPPGNVSAEATHVVWTGFEVWVWTAGGRTPAHGAAWDPARRSWRRLARHPGIYGWPAVTWSGSRLYVVDSAGVTMSLGRGTEGWRRHPTADMGGGVFEVAWTGRRLAAYLPDSERLASLDPRGGAWAETTTPPGLGPTDSAALLWTGRHLFVFGGGAAAVQGGLPEDP